MTNQTGDEEGRGPERSGDFGGFLKHIVDKWLAEEKREPWTEEVERGQEEGRRRATRRGWVSHTILQGNLFQVLLLRGTYEDDMELVSMYVVNMQ